MTKPRYEAKVRATIEMLTFDRDPSVQCSASLQIHVEARQPRPHQTRDDDARAGTDSAVRSRGGHRRLDGSLDRLRVGVGRVPLGYRRSLCRCLNRHSRVAVVGRLLVLRGSHRTPDGAGDDQRPDHDACDDYPSPPVPRPHGWHRRKRCRAPVRARRRRQWSRAGAPLPPVPVALERKTGRVRIPASRHRCSKRRRAAAAAQLGLPSAHQAAPDNCRVGAASVQSALREI